MGKFNDLTGMRFGRLTVQKRVETPGRHGARWLCRCDCGGVNIVNTNRLKTGYTKSCGCLSRELSVNNAVDMIGKKVGRWLVIERSGSTPLGLCDCGVEKVVRGSTLRNGESNSCGCLQLDAVTKHGATSNADILPEYSVWVSMKGRCNNKLNNVYRYYGARGIKVCDRWRDSFNNFIEDMGRCPHGMSIDRINNDGDYSVENSRWATHKQQAQNSRKAREWVVHNIPFKTAIDAAKHFSVSENTIRAWCGLRLERPTMAKSECYSYLRY